MLSKKDLITMNKLFSTGHMINPSSLDYAVTLVARSRNWLRSSAIMARCLLIDHVFEDGNKRTAALAITTIMEMNNISYDPAKIPAIVLYLSKKSIVSVREIERSIKDGIRSY